MFKFLPKNWENLVVACKRFGFLALFIFAGCSSIEYISENKIPVYFTYIKDHDADFKLEGTEAFYLFGQVPQKRQVVLDDLLLKESFSEASKIQIQEFLKPTDMIFSLISLGLYTPRSYVVTGRGIRE